jgi:hypothetical protein
MKNIIITPDGRKLLTPSPEMGGELLRLTTLNKAKKSAC